VYRIPNDFQYQPILTGHVEAPGSTAEGHRSRPVSSVNGHEATPASTSIPTSTINDDEGTRRSCLDQRYAEGYSSSDDYRSDSTFAPSPAYVACSNMYATIDSKAKWLLSTGMRVEDLILDACKSLSGADGLLPSFILDLSDVSIKVHFKEAEIEEIKKAFPSLPAPNKALLNILGPYFTVCHVMSCCST